MTIRFIKFKVPGELRHLLVNTNNIDWIGGTYQAEIHFRDDHITVEAPIDEVERLLEAEFGQILDGTPSDG